MHGMWGSTSHMESLVLQLTHTYPDAIVHNSDVNSIFHTFHGIDVCGYRLCDDILQLLESLKERQIDIT